MRKVYSYPLICQEYCINQIIVKSFFRKNLYYLRLTMILFSERMICFFTVLLLTQKISRTQLMGWHPDGFELEREVVKKHFNDFYFYSPPNVPSERNRNTCQENLL